MENDDDWAGWWGSRDAWELYWGDTGHHLKCLNRFWSVREPASSAPARRFAKQWRSWRKTAGESLEDRRVGLTDYTVDALAFGMYDSIAGPARGRGWR